MFPSNSYVIRKATAEDSAALHELAELDSRSPIGGSVLIGEIDGRPAAAISLADGRIVADPFQRTAQLTQLLRMRANSLRALERRPSLRDRMYSRVRVAGVWRPQT